MAILEYQQKSTPVVNNDKRPMKPVRQQTPNGFESELKANGKRVLKEEADWPAAIVTNASQPAAAMGPGIGDLFSHAAMLRLLQVSSLGTSYVRCSKHG